MRINITKGFVVALAAICMFFAAFQVAIGDEALRDTNVKEVPFKVSSEKQADEDELISIAIGGRYKIPLGSYSGEGGSFWGVMIDSINVKIIGGAPELLHINWVDYIQGNGGYQNEYYVVCLGSYPQKIIARGFIRRSGAWGWGTGLRGSYQIERSDGNLIIMENEIYNDISSEGKKPLYHWIREMETYACRRSNSIKRTYRVRDNGLKLVRAIIEYTSQEGDTMEDVCGGFDAEESWILNGDRISAPGSTIRIRIPNSVAEKRYPAINMENPY